MTEELHAGDIIREEYIYLGEGPLTLEVDENGKITRLDGHIHRATHEKEE